MSLLGSVLFNTLTSIIFQNFDLTIWTISAAASVIIPLIWTGICLPLTYWFGFRSAQTMGLLAVIPMFYMIKYFEDGSGFSAMVSSLHSFIFAACISAVILFGISAIISVAGYRRKQ